MSIQKDQLKNLIIEPTLKEIDLHSEAAVKLLLGTAAQESHLGTYVHQIKGPALSIYQIEPKTYNDIVNKFILTKPTLSSKICKACNFVGLPAPDRMITDLKFATIMCRVYYLRIAEALPDANDLEGLARYWKKYYNTHFGKGKPEEFIANYKKYVGG